MVTDVADEVRADLSGGESPRVAAELKAVSVAAAGDGLKREAVGLLEDGEVRARRCCSRAARPAASTVTLTDQTKAGPVEPREHGPEMQPTKIGRGQGKYYDPFYAFEQIARYHGDPPPPPEPKKGALLAVEVLTSKAAVIVMGCVLAGVVFAFVLVLVLRG